MSIQTGRGAGPVTKRACQVLSLLALSFAAAEPGEEEGDSDFSERLAQLWKGGGTALETDERVQRTIAEWVDRDGVRVVDQIGALDAPGAGNRFFYRSNATVREFALHRLALTDVDAALKSNSYAALVSKQAGRRSREVEYLSQLVLDRAPEQVLQMVRDGTFSGSDAEWQRAGAALYHHHEDWHTWITSLGNSERWQRSANRWELARGIAKGLISESPREDLYDVCDSLALEEEGALSKYRSRRAPFSFSQSFRKEIDRHLAATDLDYAKELAEKGDHGGLRSAIRQELAAEGKDALLAWRPEERGPSASLSARTVMPLLTGMATPELVGFLNSYPIRGGAKAYVGWMREEDLPAMIDQLRGLPASKTRDELLKEAVSNVLDHEPGRLFEFAGHLPANERTAFVDQMTERFSMNDPVVFGRAIVANSSHPLALRAGAKLVEGWANYSSRTASRWVRSLPAGDLRDTAAAVLIGSAAPYDAKSALKWAVELGGQKARIEAIAKCLAVWMESDPEGAGAAAKGLGLSGAERSEVTRRMRDLKP